MRAPLPLLGLALLGGCTFLLELDGPARLVEAADVGPAADGPAPPDAEPDAAPPEDAARDASTPDVAFEDAGPMQVLVTDLRGGGGEHDGTRWEGRALRLLPGRSSGTFTSRIFAVDAPVRWDRVRWWPSLAYGRPLPDGGGAEAGYPAGNLDMRSNVLLLHLDDPAFLTGEAVSETSGAGHRVEVLGNEAAASRGVFGGGLSLGLPDRLSVSSDHPAFRFGTEDFTWSTFVRTTGCEASNHVLMGGENPTPGAEGPGTHMWLGCQVSDDCEGGEGLGGTQRPAGGPTVNACAAATYADGRWHHVALVKAGHTPGELRWLVDGEVALVSGPVDFGEARFDLDGGLPFTVGAFPRGEYDTEGTFDEIALWHRALSTEDVEAIACRGLCRASVQVRACVTPGCDADPPFGPDLTDDFSRDDGVVERAIALGPARYIQYRVNLTGQGALSPQLLRVELAGQPEAP
ncbi:MAG: LamG domain-containing protein [Myxococcales bacterium]|nr:LamG domain-containing protein [Myxococcales bacterium]